MGAKTQNLFFKVQGFFFFFLVEFLKVKVGSLTLFLFFEDYTLFSDCSLTLFILYIWVKLNYNALGTVP